MNFDYQGIHGYDVSLWNDDPRTAEQIDFNHMKSTGAQFVGVKAGQNAYTDPDFKYNWIESKKAGLVRFSYFFCGYEVKPKLQAQNYWDILQLDFNPEEMCFADYENGSWTDWYQLYIFLNEFQMLSGLPSDKVGIYTGYPYWTQHRPFSDMYLKFFAEHPLFLAWYTSDPAYVRVPLPWTEVLLWQDGTPVIDVGQESPKIDSDKFNGDQIKFKKHFGSSAPTPAFPSSVYIGEKTYEGV